MTMAAARGGGQASLMRFGWVLLSVAACSSPPPVDAGVPPRPADAGGVPHGAVETYAIDSILLGDTDRAGALSNSAWRTYGYDLDGLVTTQDSTDVCTRPSGSPRSNQADGDGGIDNATGSIVLPVLETMAGEPTPSVTETQAIRAGAFTLELALDGPSDTPSTAGIGLAVFTGASLGAPPTFDGQASWPVLASSLVDGATLASGARVALEDGYVTGAGIFVSGVPSDVPVVLPLWFPDRVRGALVLRVHRAVITFRHDASDPTRLVDGTIAGVLDPDELIEAVRSYGDANSRSLCGAAFDGIALMLQETQDILRDGTNAPGVPCDAISVGLGFTARRVGAPTAVAADAPAPPSLCDTPDAGAADAGDAAAGD